MCFLLGYTLVCGVGGVSFLILGVVLFSWVWGILLLYWVLFFEKARGGGKNMIKIYLNFKNVLNN